ncbi:MAG: CotH kinase family protein [Firmicutes bacterium]|nr:CotH kinase family protein [Bacillota bacterium]
MNKKIPKITAIAVAAGFLILLMSIMAFAAGGPSISVDPVTSETASNSATAIKQYKNTDGNNYIFLPSFADPSSLKVWIDGADSIEVDGKTIKNGDVTDAFSKLGKFVINPNSDNISVTFMKSENIASVFILTQSGSMNMINASPGHTYSETGWIRILSSSGSDAYNGELSQIKGRGNSSWQLAKKPYQIKLNDSADLFGMGKHKTWVLIANHLDKCMLHNSTTYYIADKIGLAYTPKSVFADVYANGKYLGTYTIGEKTQVGKNRIEITDLEALTEEKNSEKLSKYPRGGEYESASAGTYKYYEIPNNPENITGGYLLEFDYAQRYKEEPCGFVTDRGQCIVIKSPEYASKAQVEYIRNYYQELEDAVYSEDGKNSLGKHYTEYMDLTSAAKRFLIEELTMNVDSCMSSFYLYKNTDGIFYFGPVWDYDLSFGISADKTLSSSKDPSTWWTNIRKINKHPEYYSMLAELFKYGDFQKAITKEFNESFKKYAHELYDTKIDQMASDISASYKMNYTIWNINSVNHYVDNNGETMDDNVKFFKNFFKTRLDFMESTIGTANYPISTKFKDVSANSWYIDAVKLMSAKGYITGTSEDTFSPNVTMSKAMFAQIIWNMCGKPSAEYKINDVYTNDWYYSAVNWAVTYGIADLDADGNFNPKADISRNEMVSMLYKYTCYLVENGRLQAENPKIYMFDLTRFSDLKDIDSLTKDVFEWACANGIISGYPDSTILPQNSATRAEASMILFNYLKLYEK